MVQIEAVICQKVQNGLQQVRRSDTLQGMLTQAAMIMRAGVEDC